MDELIERVVAARAEGVGGAKLSNLLDEVVTELRRVRDEPAIALLADIRFALGDNGKRMQPELIEYCRELAALAERGRAAPVWMTMDSCPVGEQVLLWNQDTQEMFFGYRPEDAPSPECVVSAGLPTAAYADAWMPKPHEPDSETVAPEGTCLRLVPERGEVG